MNFIKKVKKNKVLLLMLLPALVHVLIFKYLPMFGTLIAFKDFKYSKGFFKSEWVGFDNFKFLFQSQDAWIITRNTVCYSLTFILLGMVLAIGIAIAFDLLGRSKVNRINQVMVIFPHFISWMIVTYFVSALLDADKGILNGLITLFGGERIIWYSETKYWPFIIILLNFWKTLGFSSIIYYSNIKGFSADCYEAAQIDGASWWQQVVSITLPLLKPTAIILLIMNIGSVFYSDFGLFYLVPKNSGALYPVTSTIDTYVYNGLTGGGNIGATTATGLYQSTVGFILVITTNAIIKRISSENAMF